MSTSYASNAGSSAILVYEYLASQGVDADAVLSEAGLKRENINKPTDRVAWDSWSKLLELAIQATGDPNIALQLGDYIHPTSYYPMGISYLSSSTLYDFCQRAVRYSQMISTNYQMDYVEEDDRGWLICSPVSAVKKSPMCYATIEGWLVAVLRYARYMYRPDYHPLKVEVLTPCANDNQQAYEDYFGCPVEFGASRTAICFELSDLNTPLPTANADLARQSDAVVMEFLRKMGRVDIIGEVHAHIISMLPSGSCTMEKVASVMCMSSRSLHYKLSDAGFRFQELFDDTRRELAEDYIQKDELSVSEIAYMLGFSDCSNFTRAFKRWTGTTPTEYRAARQA